MKTNHHNYQPEDIEALLMEKSFRELYEEEKRFVLEHLSSQQEYERMRETLLAIRGGSGGAQHTHRMPPRVKQELLAEFQKERKKRAAFWWNSFFFRLRDLLRFDLPVVRIAFASVLLLLASWMVFRFTIQPRQEHPVAVKNGKTIPPSSPSLMPAPADSSRSHEPVAPAQDERPVPVYPPVQHDPVTDAALPPADTVHDAPAPAVNLAQHPAPDTIADRAVYSGTMNSSGYPIPNQTGVIAENTDTGRIQLPLVVNSAATNCCGQSINLTVSGGSASYSWIPSSSLMNSSGYPLPSTAYTFVTGNENCCVSATVTVNEKSRPLAADAGAISLFYQLK